MSKMSNPSDIRLTQYSHGAGCGCKIAPAVLDTMLKVGTPPEPHAQLVVGNDTRDDAAVYDIGGGRGIVSTTDFFMPIVDDAQTFGQIAATNAISDIYAMGGRPLMAIAILGWPIKQLPAELAGEVLAGARLSCAQAGIPLAGGHSIDSPEPIFGLAVTGEVRLDQLKRNATARAGDLLYLSKPLGVGVLTTALKKGLLRPEHADLAPQSMLQLNSAGLAFAQLEGVHAMTDVTGFGLLGHLVEMAEGSGLQAVVQGQDVPCLPHVQSYIEQGAVPGGSERNWQSYGHKIGEISAPLRALLCDPQTSGGLLVAVEPAQQEEFEACAREEDLSLKPLGMLQAHEAGAVVDVR